MYKTLTDVERVIAKGKSAEVVDTFVASYLQGLELEAWNKAKEVEHEALYPKQIPNPDYVAPLEQRIVNPLYVVDGTDPYWIPNPDYVEPVSEFIDNVDFIDFDTYMSETKEVAVGQKDIYDEDGFTVIGSEPVMEDQLIRVFEEVPVDIAAWKTSAPSYNQYLEVQKNTQLDRLEVTTSSGKTFYADPDSRSDLVAAILLGDKQNKNSTKWKLSKKVEGQAPLLGTEKVYDVTKDELIEALGIALETKGQIVGAV